MEKLIQDYTISARGEVYCIPKELGCYYTTSKNEKFHFIGGQQYKFNITDTEAIYENSRYEGDVVIPMSEFCKQFETEEDNFNRLENELDKGYTSIGGDQEIYGVYLSNYRYRIFINAYPVKNSDGEWVLPEKGVHEDKPMFAFETGAFGGCSTIDKHKDRPVKLGLEIKVNALRDHSTKWSIEKDNETQIRMLQHKLRTEITLMDYLKCLKTKFNENVFRYFHGSGERFSVTNLTFGSYSNCIIIQFSRRLDGSEYGVNIETEKMLYFFYIKHDGKWKPWFHKRENNHCGCAL